MYRCMYVEVGSLDKSPGHARDEKHILKLDQKAHPLKTLSGCLNLH